MSDDTRGMTKDEYFEWRRKRIAQLNAEKSSLETDLSNAEEERQLIRDDFVIIESQELRLAQIIYVLQNNTDMLDCMTAAKDVIDGLTVGEEKMIGINSLLNMDDVFLPGKYSSDVSSSNNDYISDITSLGNTFDGIRGELAIKLEEKNREIDIINQKIADVNNQLELLGV